MPVKNASFVPMARKSYVADLPGGTATTTIQMTGKQTLKRVVFSMEDAAAGKFELSTSSTSQIGTAQPTDDVVVRGNSGGTAGPRTTVFEVSIPVVPFQSLYIHQTGTGNLGTVTLIG